MLTECASDLPLLVVSNLTTAFATSRGEITAVEDVSFSLDEGEILGIVGESGSGKSVTALTIMGLLPQPPARVAAGEVCFAGEVLTRLSDTRMQRIRGPGILHDRAGGTYGDAAYIAQLGDERIRDS